MPATDNVTAAEACAILNLTDVELDQLVGRHNGIDLHHLTVRHLLAIKVTVSVAALANFDVALRAGATAADGALAGGNRLLVIAHTEGEFKAFWREADASFRVIMPFVGVPCDSWLTALIDIVDDHRRTAGRPN